VYFVLSRDFTGLGSPPIHVRCHGMSHAGIDLVSLGSLSEPAALLPPSGRGVAKASVSLYWFSKEQKLHVQYAPVASTSCVFLNPSHPTSGYSVTFGSDEADVSQLISTPKSSKKFLVPVCSLLDNALVASILCSSQNPSYSTSGYLTTSSGDEVGVSGTDLGPKKQKKDPKIVDNS
jgi:hypothetical protein